MFKLYTSLLALTLATSSALVSADGFRSGRIGIVKPSARDLDQELSEGDYYILDARDTYEHLDARKHKRENWANWHPDPGRSMKAQLERVRAEQAAINPRDLEDDEELLQRDFDGLSERDYILDERDTYEHLDARNHKGGNWHPELVRSMKAQLQRERAEQAAINPRDLEDDEELLQRDFDGLSERDYILDERDTYEHLDARKHKGGKAVAMVKHHAADGLQQAVTNINDQATNNRRDLEDRDLEDDEELFQRDFDDELFGREWDGEYFFERDDFDDLD